MQFVLIRAIRNLRGHQNQHCSMMVNVSRFIAVQKTVRNHLSTFIKSLKEAIKANYAMPEGVSSNNEHMAKVERVFHEQFGSCGFDWAEVKASLFPAIEHLKIFLVNSKVG